MCADVSRSVRRGSDGKELLSIMKSSRRVVLPTRRYASSLLTSISLSLAIGSWLYSYSPVNGGGVLRGLNDDDIQSCKLRRFDVNW